MSKSPKLTVGGFVSQDQESETLEKAHAVANAALKKATHQQIQGEAQEQFSRQLVERMQGRHTKTPLQRQAGKGDVQFGRMIVHGKEEGLTCSCGHKLDAHSLWDQEPCLECDCPAFFEKRIQVKHEEQG